MPTTLSPAPTPLQQPNPSPNPQPNPAPSPTTDRPTTETARPTRVPILQCSLSTGEEGTCIDGTCNSTLVEDPGLCPTGLSCCLNDCDVNDASTECCADADCTDDLVCSNQQCVCAFECCQDSDCGDPDVFFCNTNDECELLECDVTDANTECCASSDCETGLICEETFCVSPGAPRFTLTWVGDGKFLHLSSCSFS